jgi:quinol monooxygenase YgiN
MSKVSVVAKLTAQPGKRDDLVAALGGLLSAVEDEPGTLFYVANTDAKDADVVWFFEVYESQEALQAHQGSEAMKAAGGALGGLLAAMPELYFGEPVGGKGL